MFGAEQYPLMSGRCTLRPTRADDVASLATTSAAIDPWLRYGATSDDLARFFDPAANDGARRMTLSDGSDRPIGLVIIRWPWLMGPYVAFLAVLPGHQRAGLGTAILDAVEEEARSLSQRNVWLCVTGFNAAAQAFYRARGYHQAGQLDDLIADGTPELLMRKRL
jgi:ribosomal protein S18 acetylase RimI-like enzyme